MTVIGIDLGTTNSLAVAYSDGQVRMIPNSFGEYLTPSGSTMMGRKSKWVRLPGRN